MKIKFALTLISIISSSQILASESQKILYANIYADQLVTQFDQELSLKEILSSDDSMMESDSYINLLASREYIEKKEGDIVQFGESSILLAKNSISYRFVVSEIQLIANEIKRIKSNYKSFNKNVIRKNPVLYPAINGAGNVTGNTFPENVWSLTFDDGPRDGRTQTVVDNLYRHNMKASFFVLAKQVNKFPKAIQYILNNDMELALHSYNHLNLAKQDEVTREYEIGTSKKEIEDKFNVKIDLFRLPYGAGMRDKVLRAQIAKHKLIHIFWNVDTLDWKDKNPQSIFDRTTKQMKLTPKKSGVILFHDIHAQTVIASEMVMEYLNKQSSTVCLLGDIIKYHNGIKQTCLK